MSVVGRYGDLDWLVEAIREDGEVYDYTKKRRSYPIIGGLQQRVIIRHSVEAYCESPIEADFATQLLECFGWWHKKIIFCPEALENELSSAGPLLIPQFRWRGYRIDFCIRRGARLLFIECDGKQFHSTEDQVRNDRRKDAAVAKAGIPLLRFQGAELVRFKSDIAALVCRAMEGVR